jgi:hypothetical protein
MRLLHGDSAGREVSKRVAAPCADAAAIQAIPPNRRSGGMLCVKLDNNSLWVFVAGSSTAASATILQPDSGTGRWHHLATAATS